MIERTFPATRLRRLRRTDWTRRLVAETHLSPNDLILPLFIMEGKGAQEPIATMPHVMRHTIDKAVGVAKEAADAGIPAIALFPNTPAAKRDETGREALNPDNLVCRAVRTIKDAVPHIGIMCDAALDPYTSHGHDGLMQDGAIVNDATLDVLVQQALVQTQAGCDIIAPSDMMDGRVGVIRRALEEANHKDTLIMAYSAKYASAFYGPFRDAVGSKDTLKGDKRSYQMDARNSDEALHEIALDINEGADMVMVKPGMPYLDIVAACKQKFGVPTFAYQVSGEYAMLASAIDNQQLSEAVIMESLIAFKRAGADGVLSYFALRVARLLTG